MESAIAELLSNILHTLPTPELVKCRLVSWTWKEESTRLLRKRRDLKLFFVYPNNSSFVGSSSTFELEFEPKPLDCKLYHRFPRQVFTSSSTPQQQQVDLPNQRESFAIADFTSFLFEIQSTLQNPSFLLNHLDLDCTDGVYELSEVVQFLQFHGEPIKTLGLTHYPNYYEVIPNLLHFTPNLEALNVRSCEWNKSFAFCGFGKDRRVSLKSVLDSEHGFPVKTHLKVLWESKQDFPILPHLKSVWVQLKVQEDFLWKRLFGHRKRENTADKELVRLLTRAPAVKSVKFTGVTFPLEVTSDLSNVNKLHLLQIEGLNLELFQLLENNLEDLIHLEELAGTKSGPGPKVGIETMDIFTKFTTLQSFLPENQIDGQLTHNWRRIFVCLVKFLENNRKTLTCLSIGNAACHLWKNPKTVGFIPKLENVTKLKFRWTDTEFMEFQRQNVHNNVNNPPENSYNYDYVPPELYENFPVPESPDFNSISNMFPGLETLIISWTAAHVNWFPFWDEIFPTVKNLEMPLYDSPEADIHLVTPKFAAMFPALTSLNMDIYAEGFARNFGELLKFRTLEELTLGITSDWSKDVGERRADQLITMAAILGVEVQILLEVCQKWVESGNCEILQNLSINPSIFTLTGLKKLGLKLSHFNERLCAFFVGCIGQLGVDKIADFKVCITLSHCGNLGQLKANTEPIREFETLCNRFPKVEVAILKH